MKRTLLLFSLLIATCGYGQSQETQQEIRELEKRVNQLITMFKEQGKQLNKLSDEVLTFQQKLQEDEQDPSTEPEYEAATDENEDQDDDMAP